MRDTPQPTPEDEIAKVNKAAELSPEIHHQIQRYIDKYLPPSEQRIPEKINPACQVVIVIPAYGERNYILRPLNSLAAQTGVRPEEYEVIIVVNNPPNPPQKSKGQSEQIYQARLRHYESAKEDNPKTIELLDLIQSPKSVEGLNPAEQDIVKNIRNSRVVVHVVDKASLGKMLPIEQANVGGARNRGVAEATERFTKISRNGIIAQSDADIQFESDYIANLIRQYETHPDVVGFRGAVDLETESDSSTMSEEALKTRKLKRLYESLLSRYKESHYKSSSSVPTFWGSNMSSRAWQTALVDGVPLKGEGEDLAFGARLAAVGKIGYANDVKVAQLARVSVRAESGHGHRILKDQERVEKGLSLVVANPFLGPKLEQLTGPVKSILLDEDKTARDKSWEQISEFLVSQGINVRDDRLKELVSSAQAEHPVAISDMAIRLLITRATKIPLETAIEDLLALVETDFDLKNTPEYKDLSVAFKGE